MSSRVTDPVHHHPMLILFDRSGTPKLIISGTFPRPLIRHEGELYLASDTTDTEGPDFRRYNLVEEKDGLTILDTSAISEGVKLSYVAHRLTASGEPDGRSSPKSR